MRKIFGVSLIFMLASFGRAQEKARLHPTRRLDVRTAQRIAEAVLIGQFGEQRVKEQMPLIAQSTRASPAPCKASSKTSRGRVVTSACGSTSTTQA